MAVNDKQLSDYAEKILRDEALDVVLERISLRYWDAFRKAQTVEDRALISARQDVLEDFVGELVEIKNSWDLETGDSDE